MKHIKEFESFFERRGETSVTAKVEEFEKVIGGTYMMIDATVEGNLMWEPGWEEEGHGIHTVGQGYEVEIEDITLDTVYVDVLETYCKVELEKSIEKKIIEFLKKDREFQSKAEEALIDSME